MLAFAASIALAAAPVAPVPPAPWPDVPAPLGHFGNVVEPVPPGGVPDRVVVPTFGTCKPQAIYLLRALSGTARALEQAQLWLDAIPGQEKKLFQRKEQLGEVARQLSGSKYEPRRACAPLPAVDGWRLELAAHPTKWCDAPADATTGDFWFFTGKQPAAVVSVLPGSPDACRPRISTILFDTRGQARIRVHADWGAAASMTLVGDKCQQVDFTFDSQKQAFSAAPKSCKR